MLFNVSIVPDHQSRGAAVHAEHWLNRRGFLEACSGVLAMHDFSLRTAQLCNRNRAITASGDRVAMRAIGWMPAAVTHDSRVLLALDVVIHARHPGANLVHELALAEGHYMIGPFGDAIGRGRNPR